MKTGWDKFPWADYRAQDKNGAMWYYENKPVIDEDCWKLPSSTLNIRQDKDCDLIPNWKDTLETRPVPSIKVDEEVIVLFNGKWYVGTTYSNEDGYFIDPCNDYLFRIAITPELKWKYISDLEITL
jgi:hypothetical protein